MNNIIRRSAVAATLICLVGSGLVACAPAATIETGSDAPPVQESTVPLDLLGEWKQTNSASPDSYQRATITADSIEVYWVSDNGDTESLYWAGSYSVPTGADSSYSWESTNDHSKTDSAMLASSDDAKTFSAENGELSYKVSMLGTTTTVKLSQQ